MNHPETRLQENRCPLCRHLLDAASCVNDQKAQPTPGSPSVCMYCGEVSVFDDKLSLRKPTASEAADFNQNPHWELLRRAVDLIGQFRARGQSIN
jgi:hypothetical protein